MAELPPLPEARIESYQTDAVMRRTTLHTYSASDMRAYAEEAIKLDRAQQETDRDWSEAQDWKGMDGATAWLLINRHADGWGDTRAMMEAWLAANAEQAVKQEREAYRELWTAAARVALSNGFDAAYPDNLAALQSMVQATGGRARSEP